MAGKIPSDLHGEILARVASNATLPGIVAWLKKSHRVEVSKQALSKLVQKHRAERREVAKTVVSEHIQQTLPADLAALDAVQARNLGLLERAQAEALTELSVANVEKVVKLTTIVQRADEAKKKALGLEQPNEVITDLAALLAKA